MSTRNFQIYDKNNFWAKFDVSGHFFDSMSTSTSKGHCLSKCISQTQRNIPTIFTYLHSKLFPQKLVTWECLGYQRRAGPYSPPIIGVDGITAASSSSSTSSTTTTTIANTSFRLGYLVHIMMISVKTHARPAGGAAIAVVVVVVVVVQKAPHISVSYLVRASGDSGCGTGGGICRHCRSSSCSHRCCRSGGSLKVTVTREMTCVEKKNVCRSLYEKEYLLIKKKDL